MHDEQILKSPVIHIYLLNADDIEKIGMQKNEALIQPA